MLKRLFAAAAAALTLTSIPATAQIAARDAATVYDQSFIHAAPPIGRSIAGRAGVENGVPGEVSEAAAALKKAGVSCQASAGRMLSRTSKGALYEVACRDTFGWDVAVAGDGSAAAEDCLTLAGSSKGLSHCLLGQNRSQLKGLQALADAAKVKCTVTDGEWLGSGGKPPIHRYEATCREGGGYILDAPQPGTQSDLIATACKDAPSFGLACIMKPPEEGYRGDPLAEDAGGRRGRR